MEMLVTKLQACQIHMRHDAFQRGLEILLNDSLFVFGDTNSSIFQVL